MRRALAGLLAVLAVSSLWHGEAYAQAAQGHVTGVLRSGTAGVDVADGVRVELITLDQDGSLDAQETVTEHGRFEFTVSADPGLTHLVRALYEGVSYFATEPVLLSAELPQAEREITVYAATGEAPALRIDSTVMTAFALDRANAQLTLVREDAVTNPSDRTYTGDGRGVTLRLPAPDGAVEADGSASLADGLPQPGGFVLEGGIVAISAPLQPGRTLVVSRYIVGYDQTADAYLLRATAPLPTGRLELRIPERFADELRVLGEAMETERAEIDGERMLVAAPVGEARAGESAVVELAGLAGRLPAHPLTTVKGATLATVLSLSVLAAGIALWRLAGRRRALVEPA